LSRRCERAQQSTSAPPAAAANAADNFDFTAGIAAAPPTHAIAPVPAKQIRTLRGLPLPSSSTLCGTIVCGLEGDRLLVSSAAYLGRVYRPPRPIARDQSAFHIAAVGWPNLQGQEKPNERDEKAALVCCLLNARER
jgi:hypothetical protein